ncbi:integrase core domain-containing protein [Thalassobacter stenotrophicus]|uniref:integrase core domain-containing protein n=1 Tax=Thalassobacter stenotrophicus TaxID=266809 RepID=UPI00398FC40C
MLIPCSRHSSETGTPPSACFNTAMIRASLNRPFFIVNPLRYLPEKILRLNTSNFRGMTEWPGCAATSFIPGKPRKTAHIESCNRRVRDECLKQRSFICIGRARKNIAK